MSVVAGVERDLDLLSRGAVGSALAGSALALAEALDDPGASATSKAMCAKSLLETLARLGELYPAASVGDRIDDLSDRRRRRVGVAAS